MSQYDEQSEHEYYAAQEMECRIYDVTCELCGKTACATQSILETIGWSLNASGVCCKKCVIEAVEFRIKYAKETAAMLKRVSSPAVNTQRLTMPEEIR